MLVHALRIRVALAATLALLLLARAADAQVSGSTVLTFDIPGASTVPQDYGDNVAGLVQGNYGYGGSGSFTPDIAVSYAQMPQNLSPAYWGSGGYGNLVNVAYGSGTTTAMNLTFTANAGRLAVLIGFDVATWSGIPLTLSSVTVRNGAGAVLASLANVAVPSNPSGHVDIDFNPPPAEQILQLEITAVAGSWYNLGLDNVTFGQAASGLLTGQANSAAATLRVNGFGPAGLAGPFSIGVATNGVLTLDWAGAADMPLLLATGAPNTAVLNLGCIGLLDIGTPPAFTDFAIVFNGALPGFPNFLFRLGPQGTATQTFSLPGLSGLSASIQGAVVQPAGSACSVKLTAAFTLSFL